MSADAANSSDPVDTVDKRSAGMGFKIATIVLALTTIGFAIWGFVTYKNLKDTEDALASESSVVTSDKTQLQDARVVIDKLGEAYKVKDGEYKKDQSELTSLRQEYDAAQLAAAAVAATTEQKLKALETRANLAEACARTLASGLVTIYGDVATGVTYAEVANALEQASKPCTNITPVAP